MLVVFTKNFISVLDRRLLFLSSLDLLFLFLLRRKKRLSFAFDFSMSKDFSKRKELPRVNIVNCAIEKHAPRCAVAAKTPPGSSPRCEIMTRS